MLCDEEGVPLLIQRFKCIGGEACYGVSLFDGRHFILAFDQLSSPPPGKREAYDPELRAEAEELILTHYFPRREV